MPKVVSIGLHCNFSRHVIKKLNFSLAQWHCQSTSISQQDVSGAILPIKPGLLIVSVKSFHNGSRLSCLVIILYIEASATK